MTTILTQGDLQTPERIEAMLFLFKIALQMVVLIERTARANIKKEEKGLDNFMSNKNDVRNPRAEYMLAEFQYVVGRSRCAAETPKIVYIP